MGIIINSFTSLRGWNSVSQDAGMGQISQHGAEICMLLRDAGWLRDKDEAKSQVGKISAMLVGEKLELLVGYGRSLGKIPKFAAGRRDV